MMTKVIEWLGQHRGAIQGVTAILTVLIAVGALIGVKMQIDATARIQQEQSARDIYREYLNLSISRPEYAAPNYCAIQSSPQEPAYEAYVDYLLYTAEQAMAADPAWRPVFEKSLTSHRAYLCAVDDWSGYDGDVQAMVGRFRAASCQTVAPCP
jgi:hypothetical protein